jgi:hypothetical protein
MLYKRRSAPISYLADGHLYRLHMGIEAHTPEGIVRRRCLL